MISERIKIMAEFGKGTIVIGCNRIQANEASEFWYVVIKASNKLLVPGEIVEKSDVDKNTNEIYLTFPSERQMINVMAAFSNKSVESVQEKWKARKDNQKLEWGNKE